MKSKVFKISLSGKGTLAEIGEKLRTLANTCTELGTLGGTLDVAVFQSDGYDVQITPEYAKVVGYCLEQTKPHLLYEGVIVAELSSLYSHDELRTLVRDVQQRVDNVVKAQPNTDIEISLSTCSAYLLIKNDKGTWVHPLYINQLK